jgi:hypothetical protein
MADRTAVILQPSYLPWLGYFAQMRRCDVFIYYDDVQYDKHSWRNRNRVKTAQGPQWLTVPVLTHGRDKPLIRDVEVDNRSNWRKKHLETLRQSYARAPYFKQYLPVFEEAYSRSYSRLLDLNLALMGVLCEVLGLRRETRLASELGCEKSSPVGRLIGLCHAVGATTFYEGASGKEYIDDSEFARSGLRIEYQDYQHPTYEQQHGEFAPYLSIVDLLFNCGPRSLEILSQ